MRRREETRFVKRFVVLLLCWVILYSIAQDALSFLRVEQVFHRKLDQVRWLLVQ